MVRALDHLVLPCRDLAAAAAFYGGLGFIVGRRNRHPWGTENHIVQVDGAFLELIAMAPDQPPPAPGDAAFPFAGFLAGLGASRAPSGMIVLRSADAEADAAAFSQDGIGEGRMLHFSRTGAAPDGGARTVSFSLAFATAPAMPDLGFFTCRQHTPEHFWNPAAQHHANGVTGIAAVTLVARAPAAQAAFLSRFADQAAVESPSGGIVLDLGNSRIEVVEATETGDGPMAGDDRPARLAAIRFAGKAITGVPARVVSDDGIVLLFG